MHGCGNDYVFVDTIGGPELPEGVDVSRLAAELADRHFGVGGDGMIIIQRARSGRLGMRMFNSDGSEGRMCGNGMRCLAKYCYEEGYVDTTRFEVETLAGIIVPEVAVAPGPRRRVVEVTVDLGPPREIRSDLEVVVGEGPGSGRYRGTFVSLGSPHFVIPVSEAAAVDLAVVGPALERHAEFADRANIEFVEVRDRSRLRMRVWERGSGITLACGTGAGATVVAGAVTGLSARRVMVVVDGGELMAEWTPQGPVLVTGPAEEVFRTTYSRPMPRLEAGAAGSGPGGGPAENGAAGPEGS